MASEDWKEYRLDQLLEVRHGFAFPGEGITDEPTTDILVTPGNFAIGGGWKGSKFKYFNGDFPEEYILSQGDLVVTMTDLSKTSDTLGYPALIPTLEGHRLLHNQRIGKVLVKNDDVVDVRFLYYLLCTQEYRNEVLASASGSTVKHTSPGRIGAFVARVPDEDTQHEIASILGALDDKIELNRRMNGTLEAMAQALFKEWFVDGAKEEWEEKTIGDIADVIDCLHSKKPERQDAGLPLMQLWNICDNGLLDMSDPYFITEPDYRKWISRMEAREGDCVITNVGRVGAVSQVPPGLKAALGRNMTGVRCKPSFPYPTFLIQCLLSGPMRVEIERRKDPGTVMDSLNVRNIPKLTFIMPPNALIERFEALARPLRQRMEANLSESRTLTALRDTLLPKLMRGEVRVKQHHMQ